MAKTKCICCKFDNCLAEFKQHRSNTTFAALDHQFSCIASLMESPKDHVQEVCTLHREIIGVFINKVFSEYDNLNKGVMLPKITRR